MLKALEYRTLIKILSNNDNILSCIYAHVCMNFKRSQFRTEIYKIHIHLCLELQHGTMNFMKNLIAVNQILYYFISNFCIHVFYKANLIVSSLNVHRFKFIFKQANDSNISAIEY